MIPFLKWILLTLIPLCVDIVNSLKIQSLDVPKYAKVRPKVNPAHICFFSKTGGGGWSTLLQNYFQISLKKTFIGYK